MNEFFNRMSYGIDGIPPAKALTDLLENSDKATSVYFVREKLQHDTVEKLSGDQQTNYIEELNKAAKKIQKPVDDLNQELSDSIHSMNQQLKYVDDRIDELSAIILGTIAKAEEHAKTIPVPYEEEKQKEFAFAIAWIQKRDELQKKLDSLADEKDPLLVDHRHELQRILQHHNQIGITIGALVENKEDGVAYTKLGNIAHNWINTQFNDPCLDWKNKNDQIYSPCLNRMYEFNNLKILSKKLKETKGKLDQYDQYLKACQNPQLKQFGELKEVITGTIELAKKHWTESPEAAQAENIVKAVGGYAEPETGQSAYGLPQLGNDGELETLDPTIHAQIKAINADLTQIKPLEKGLRANPNSECLKEQYETLLMSLKKNFNELENTLKEYKKAETLILLKQLQNFNTFFERYNNLRANAFSTLEQFLKTNPLKTPPTPEEFDVLLEECTLWITDPQTGKQHPARGENGQPLNVSNAAFLKALNQFKGSVKITQKGNKTLYRFSSREDLSQFIKLCAQESMKEQKEAQEKNQKKPNDDKDKYSVREAQPEAITQQSKKHQEQAPESQGAEEKHSVRVAEPRMTH